VLLPAQDAMGFYSVWAFLGCMVLLFLAASTPALRGADTAPNPHGVRVSSIDGLRGILALAVFFHHTAVTHQYWQSGVWTETPSRFYNLLGQVAVAVFFMITGYLFWGKLIKEQGKPNWLKLYTGRLFRIAPLYGCAVLWLLVLVAFKTNLTLCQPALQVANEVARWFTLGLAAPDVNAYRHTATLMAAVSWTLRYEWFFYGSLILTAFWVRRRPGHLVFTVICLTLVGLYVLLYVHAEKTAPWPICVELFLIGMLCASLKPIGSQRRLPNWLSSTFVALGAAALFLRFNNANTFVPVLLLGVGFFLVVSGCDLFGLLVSRPARRLGDVSYGIYLLHGLILTCIFSSYRMRTFALYSAVNHWLVVTVTALAVIVVATVAHVFVERPGIELGKRAAVRLESALGGFRRKEQPKPATAKAFTAHK